MDPLLKREKPLELLRRPCKNFAGNKGFEHKGRNYERRREKLMLVITDRSKCDSVLAQYNLKDSFRLPKRLKPLSQTIRTGPSPKTLQKIASKIPGFFMADADTNTL